MFTKTSIAAFVACLSVAVAKPIAGVEEKLVARQSYSGEATINPVSGGPLGSCGQALSNDQMFVALSNTFMQSESPSPYCGKQIQVTNTGPNGDNSVGGQGNTVTVYVADTCPGCSQGHLDLSEAAWNQLTDNSAWSHVGITWQFLS